VFALCSPSPTATHAIASVIASVVRAGDLIVLAGEMGSGKTWFVKGFAAALGVTDHVTSPTFTLVHSYDGGRLPVHHADVYRLDRLGEVVDLALSELLEDEPGSRHGGVVLVEWGDAVAALLGNDYLEVRLEFVPARTAEAPAGTGVDPDPIPADGEADDARTVKVRAVGPGWAARWSTLTKQLEPFRC
jgi:tRNA threonylcarbamoyladenosine biosynthesis protein TsaE